MERERRRRWVAIVAVLLLFFGAFLGTRRTVAPETGGASCLAEMQEDGGVRSEATASPAEATPAGGAEEAGERAVENASEGHDRTASPSGERHDAVRAGARAASRTVEVSARFRGNVPPARKVKATAECGGRVIPDESVLVNDGGLANVFVRAVDVPPEKASGGGVEIVQEGCVYSPRVSGVTAGQAIAVTSKDAFLHNVHTFAGDVSIFNKGQPAPSTFVKRTDELVADGRPVTRGPISFRCDVHPWMLAWVVVSEHPYFAVTGSDGLASLALPEGRHEVEAWHEVYGTRTAVVSERDTSVTFEYP